MIDVLLKYFFMDIFVVNLDVEFVVVFFDYVD